MSGDERAECRRVALRSALLIVVMAPAIYAISMWFHQRAGWPYSGIEPLVGFGLLSMWLTIQLAVVVRKGWILSARGFVCMLVGTAALWASLLIDARQGAEYPMPASIAAAVALAVCWLVMAWDLRGNIGSADQQTDAEPSRVGSPSRERNRD